MQFIPELDSERCRESPTGMYNLGPRGWLWDILELSVGEGEEEEEEEEEDDEEAVECWSSLREPKVLLSLEAEGSLSGGGRMAGSLLINYQQNKK